MSTTEIIEIPHVILEQRKNRRKKPTRSIGPQGTQKQVRLVEVQKSVSSPIRQKKLRKRNRIPKSIRPQPSNSRTRVLGTGVVRAGQFGKPTIRQDGYDSCLFVGEDYVGTVSCQGTGEGAATVGDILFSTIVNPRLITGTALYNESLNWEKWTIKSLSFHFDTTQGTQKTGSVYAFIDTDPVDTLTNSPTNLNVAVRSAFSMSAAFWNTFDCAYPPDRKFTDMFIAPNGNDTRFSQGGILYVVYGGGAENATSIAIWNVTVRYEIEFRVRSLGNGGSSLGANTTFTNTNPVTASLLKGAAAVAGSQIPVTLDGDGAFSIPKYITDVNNILVSAFVGETNLSGVTELEKLALNLTNGSILEGVPSWTGIFSNTSFEQTANWLLGGSNGLSGVLNAAMFGGTYAFPTLKVLFTAVPKNVTSLGQLHHGVLHIPKGVGDPNPSGETIAWQSQSLGTWDGAPENLYAALQTGLNDPTSLNNVLWIPGGLSPDAAETNSSDYCWADTNVSDCSLTFPVPICYTNTAIQSGILYVDLFTTCELPGWSGGSTSANVWRVPYGAPTPPTTVLFDSLGPYGGQVFESMGALIDLATIPVGFWIQLDFISTKSKASSSNVMCAAAIVIYPANGVYWKNDEGKQRFKELLKEKHQRKMKMLEAQHARKMMKKRVPYICSDDEEPEVKHEIMPKLEVRRNV